MSPIASTLLGAIASKRAQLAIIGMGYIGLPLARAFSLAGFPVLGFDIDISKVAHLRSGRSYIGHIPADDIRRMLSCGFAATDNRERLSEADVVLICVPTPLSRNREPDLSSVISSAESAAAYLRSGQLIVLESTSYPGTTRQVAQPILERQARKNGVEYFLAYSPEREDPGNSSHTVSAIPKIVGGADAASLDLAASLYQHIVPSVVRVSTLEVAEAAKLLENIYRAVNIALVNELKVLYDRMGIDIWEVIDAAKTKPFGFQPFFPGPGLGGPCVPVNPFYLSWIARKYGYDTRLIELAGEINASMPSYVVGKIADALNDAGKPIKGSRVLILGVAYKKDVDDHRGSPGIAILESLIKKGASVSYNDPHIRELKGLPNGPSTLMTSSPLTAELLSGQDCVVIATDHSEYDYEFVVQHSQLVVDSRNAARTVTIGRERIVRA